MKCVALASTMMLSAILATPSEGKPQAPRTAEARIISLSRDRSIAINCHGAGHYTVILEPGDGGRRSHMGDFSTRLSQDYRVCVYDRRNVGESSSAPVPRGPADLTEDLFGALGQMHEGGPFILFGTSMGGLLVRLHAATHQVAGYVTSNQPGTPSEWIALAYPTLSDAERALDQAWMAGANNEHINVNAVGAAIDAAGPPIVPHLILISTEHFQCPAAGTCGRAYDAYYKMSKKLGESGKYGAFRVFDGDHDLYVTHAGDLVDAINAVAALADRKRSAQGEADQR
jgi:pimeloyl-ACP methyl ester carboxylesterase